MTVSGCCYPLAVFIVSAQPQNTGTPFTSLRTCLSQKPAAGTWEGLQVPTSSWENLLSCVGVWQGEQSYIQLSPSSGDCASYDHVVSKFGFLA